MGITVELQGFSEVKKIIEKYSTEKIKQLGEQVEISARAIEATAKKTVPVDTGRLRSSINVLPLGFSLEKSVEARTHYAGYVEFGTSRMAGRSYLRFAFQKHKKGFDRAIRRILEK